MGLLNRRLFHLFARNAEGGQVTAYTIGTVWVLIVLWVDFSLPNGWQHGKQIVLWYGLVAIMVARLISYWYQQSSIRLSIDVLDSIMVLRLVYLWMVHTPTLDVLDPVLIVTAYTVWYFIVRSLVRDKARVMPVFYHVLFSVAMVESILVFFQWSLAPTVLDESLKNAVFGTLGSPNSTAWVIAFGVLVVPFAVQNKRLRLLCNVIAAVAIILTESRSAMLMLLTICLYRCRRYYPRVEMPIVGSIAHRWQKSVFIFMTFAVLAFLFFLDVESSLGRVYLYRVGFEIWKANIWFGVGLNHIADYFLDAQAHVLSLPFWSDYAYKATEVHQIHNELLNACIETGLFGGTLLILAIVNAFEGCSSNFQKVFGLLLLVPVFVDAPLHVLSTSLLFYTWLGFTKRQEICLVARFELPKEKFLSGVTAVLIVVSTFVIIQTSKRYSGLQTWKTAIDALQRQSWNTAHLHLRSTEENLPTNHERDYQSMVALWHSSKQVVVLESLERLIEKHPNRSRLLTVGYANLTVGRLEKAEVYFMRVSQAFPEHVAPHRYLAEVYKRTGDFEKMENQFVKASSLYKRRPTPTNERIMAELTEVVFGE